MTDDPAKEPQTQQLTAAALRQSITDKAAAKVDEADEKRSAADRELERIFREFLDSRINQKELDEIRRKIVAATERGEFSVEVMRFHSRLCSDNGRAINNGESDWPMTLQGKAKSFYEFYLERGKPQGFRIKAQIVDFPDGMPGQVGLIVSWE